MTGTQKRRNTIKLSQCFQVALLTSLKQDIIVFPQRKKCLLVVVANFKVLDGLTLKLIFLWTQEMALAALSNKNRKQCVNQCSASISTSIKIHKKLKLFHFLMLVTYHCERGLQASPYILIRRMLIRCMHTKMNTYIHVQIAYMHFAHKFSDCCF